MTRSMENSVPPPPQPLTDPDSEGFWAATRVGELALCRCQVCREWLQPPLERCRFCAGPTAFERASGDGTIYSFIVVRHPSVPAFVRLLPYAIVLVDLAEGVRLSGRFVGELADITVGRAVRVGTERLPAADESAVVFSSAPGSDG